MKHSKEDDDDRSALLSALNAHGQAFLQSFGPYTLPSSSVKRKHEKIDVSPKNSISDLELEEEWRGINASDDDTSNEIQSSIGPRVVVFGTPALGIPSQSGVDKKAFMSSKITKMRTDASTSRSMKDLDEEEDQSNARNDILLRDLIQTSLLSGSISDATETKSPSQKRKALESRAIELAGVVKRGRGDRTLKQTERSKAIKRIRLGMEAKETESNAKRLEEAKNVGNYHPTIKNLFSDDRSTTQRKRQRGLGMGVGKFVGGTLKLSTRDLASVRGGPAGKSGRGQRK